jgi:gamma-hexachlorocyclohexane dehydrochlorinase
MTTEIEKRLDRLESRLAMLDLVSDYCLGFDKRDFERFMTIWWQDATWEIGPPFGNFQGHDGITHAVKGILWPAWLQSTHYTTNLRVVHEGPNLCHGICDVYCIGTTSDGQAQTVAATYTDRFERRGGVWKIALRHVKMHHFSPLIGITLAPPQ